MDQPVDLSVDLFFDLFGHQQLTIFYTRNEGGWVTAQVREFPGAVSQGRSRDEAFVNVLDALREVLKAGGLAGG